MSNAIYATLARQTGLMQEMQVVANNLANANTTGFKTDRAIFAEFLVDTGGENESLSMGTLSGHAFAMDQGALRTTGGMFDFAIQGDGFFLVETPRGERLTRAGHFQLSPDGNLINGEGHNVLGDGGNAIAIPEGVSRISVASDGTISADGELIGRIGVVVADGLLLRDSSTYFEAQEGFQAAPNPTVVQGALEGSNVSPILEVSRMIEVQRAYEAGQSLLEKEDQRVSQLITAMRER